MIGLGLCLTLLTGISARAEREFPDDHFFNAPENIKEKFDAMTGQPHPELSVADWMNGEFSPGELEGKVRDFSLNTTTTGRICSRKTADKLFVLNDLWKRNSASLG